MSELPPGQRAVSDLPRFGLPVYARRWPELPPSPLLSLGGDVVECADLPLSALAALPRHEQTSDLHCVATWSRTGLRWSGHRFRDFYEQLLAPRTNPPVRHVSFRGLDGYRATLTLDDALADDVLLADELDGQPLSLEHGAPLRLVAPAHYGYKHVKHLAEISVYRQFRPLRALPVFREHLRARVAFEERSDGLPAWLARRLYGALLHPTLWLYRRAERTRPEIG